MLSKVAERIYWTARYLERVENTARMVSVYDSLLFDLPRSIDISWFNLIVINSDEALFSERYRVRDERNVVKFLLSDNTNPSSMLSSLMMIRENMRTTRDVVPAETWEMINELYHFAKDNIQQGINRSQRHKFLNRIITGCQQINGLLYGAMNKDAGWQFIKLGQCLERCDMTTRILDAGVSMLLAQDEQSVATVEQIVWGNVLRSSSAYLNYRRAMRTAVNGMDVANFLLEDDEFPRSVRYCINRMQEAIKKLPKNKACVPVLLETAPGYSIEESNDLEENFREYLNQLQLNLGELHNCFAQTWFAFDLGDNA